MNIINVDNYKLYYCLYKYIYVTLRKIVTMKGEYINTGDLMTVRTYAQLYKKRDGSKGVLPQYIHSLIEKGDVKCIVIDGVKFVPKSELK